MEDWQGCLSPRCQTALQQARSSVLDRGGAAITIEDFLLALIDQEPALPVFLRQRGVDLDELTRTIQCEQPIVTEIRSEQLLSSQLQYWLALSREISSSPWLDWATLLQALTCSADRLAGKAYVAVLEQVGENWPQPEADLQLTGPPAPAASGPVVVTQASWLQLAQDVAVLAAARPKGLLWLTGPSGSGKTTWLQTLVPALSIPYLALDLRAEAEVMGSDVPVFPVAGTDGVDAPAPLLILDNVSPAALNTLMADPAGLARTLLPAHTGPILLLSKAEEGVHAGLLEHRLGRAVHRLAMPGCKAGQHRAIMTAHQPRIERQWGVELADGALRYASSMAGLTKLTPGEGLSWLAAAAARVSTLADQGAVETQRLAGEVDTLQRQILVAMARGEPVQELEAALARVSLERTASEVSWHERRAAGHLRRVLVEDLKREREGATASLPLAHSA